MSPSLRIARLGPWSVQTGGEEYNYQASAVPAYISWNAPLFKMPTDRLSNRPGPAQRDVG